ncbi:nucleotide disphospho-sugar-binding domain-containing protein [Promicromonospora iranensis]|uniref:MGT family glycosyltransferase n=1 Tax=Promicromonospora iranensis TaxID=1105144 RepID=A0ABU2CKD7_9MICO|nr:glycosyltransferase [Promicromonospora iranensis]MDR7381647.1 MGT family glycosyltransferase [Promicromonospora iranensis]
MTHSYLFALTDGGGTVPPELGAARRLVERGHRVTVLGEDSMAPEVAAAGAAFMPWQAAPNRSDRSPDGTRYRDWEIRSPLAQARGMADHMLVGPAAGQALDVTAAVERQRPDLVVTSFVALGAMLAADAEGIPFDVLLPNIYTMPAPGMPPMGMGLRPASGPLGRLRDRLVNGASTRLVDKYVLPRLNAVRGEYGLAPVDHTWDQVRRARRLLLLTSEEFDFPAQLPSNARYVGPVLDDPAWAVDTAWSAPPGDAPLVLVALSSTFQDQAACLQRIIDALGSLPVRGLVTTGPALSPTDLRAPSNVTVVASAPHRDVMRQAALVVTHGGHGTLVKAFAAGLPAVVLHHGRDQADNAVRVTTRGAGVAVRRTAPSSAVARAVRQVVEDPAYARAAEALGVAARRDAEGGLLVTELERFTD